MKKKLMVGAALLAGTPLFAQFVDSQGNPVDMSQMMMGIAIAAGVLVLIVVLIVVVRKSGKKGVRKLRLQFENLAARLGGQVAPPANDYDLPRLTVEKPEGTIRVDCVMETISRATPGMGTGLNRPLVYRNPYQEMSATGQAVFHTATSMLGSLAGGRTASYQRPQTYRKTKVALSLPEWLSGSKVLITPETLFGQVTGFREVKLDDKPFDRMFHVIAENEEPARRLLSPAVRAVLLALRKNVGKLQLNERELFVTLNGHTAKKLPETIEALLGVGRVIQAEND